MFIFIVFTLLARDKYTGTEWSISFLRDEWKGGKWDKLMLLASIKVVDQIVELLLFVDWKHSTDYNENMETSNKSRQNTNCTS